MILHLDMDAFFASIEQRDNPHLKNKPVIVAGSSSRSVTATASYEARKFGIHSAMPVFQARQLCDHLIIVPGNHEKYARESKKIMDIISGFSPLVEQVSIDEAYVDIIGCEKLFGPPQDMALAIQQAIAEKRSLTCSIGMAPVKFLAKIASDMNKPNGITSIPQEKIKDFITTLPIGKVSGVGKQAMQQMELLQIRFLGDILRLDLSLLTHKFGKLGFQLHQLAQGIDPRPVETDHVRKSISSETTLLEDISDPATIQQILLAHSQRVGQDLRKKKLVCHSVSIKIKFSDFTLISRSKKTPSWICSSAAIFQEAMGLYQKVAIKKKIRLLGVGVSHLQDQNVPIQMELLFAPREKAKKQWESVDMAVDSILEKFGRDMVKKASLTQPKEKKMSQIACIKVIVKGRVQGVFFRAETKRAADRLNLGGYVKNREDGSVEALFQGDETRVHQMVEWCRTGPRSAQVDTESAALLSPCHGFEIRY